MDSRYVIILAYIALVSHLYNTFESYHILVQLHSSTRDLASEFGRVNTAHVNIGPENDYFFPSGN